MLTKFFEKMDSLPVVRLLQVAAAILFAAGIIRLFEDFYQLLDHSLVSDGVVLNVVMLVQAAILKSFYQPVFLLGLAEIIRLKKMYKQNKG